MKLRLIPHTDEKNYVHINPNTGEGTCNSPLGMTGGKQTINFGEKCSWGNLAHEFMHSLGELDFLNLEKNNKIY